MYENINQFIKFTEYQIKLQQIYLYEHLTTVKHMVFIFLRLHILKTLFSHCYRDSLMKHDDFCMVFNIIAFVQLIVIRFTAQWNTYENKHFKQLNWNFLKYACYDMRLDLSNCLCYRYQNQI